MGRSHLLIDSVLSGKHPREVLEVFADSQTKPTLPISQFLDGVVDLDQDSRSISSDIDDLIADLGEFQQSTQIPALAETVGRMKRIKATAATLRADVNEVLAWARQHIQKLGN